MQRRASQLAAVVLGLAVSAVIGEEPKLVRERDSESAAAHPTRSSGVIAAGNITYSARMDPFRSQGDEVETADPLPPDAEAVIKVFEDEAAAIREKAEQEIQSKRQTLIKSLQALQDAYTRAARLDEAVAIRDTIRQLRVAHLKPLPNPGNLSRFANCIGQTFYFEVVGRSSYSIWGTEVYTYDSDLATAAVHAGVLKAGQRGIVKVTMINSPEMHRGSTHHGVTSYDYGPYAGSYTVELPRPTDQTPPASRPEHRLTPTRNVDDQDRSR